MILNENAYSVATAVAAMVRTRLSAFRWFTSNYQSLSAPLVPYSLLEGTAAVILFPQVPRVPQVPSDLRLKFTANI